VPYSFATFTRRGGKKLKGSPKSLYHPFKREEAHLSKGEEERGKGKRRFSSIHLERERQLRSNLVLGEAQGLKRGRLRRRKKKKRGREKGEGAR